MKSKPVLVLTSTRGVYFGYLVEDRGDTVVLKSMRHVYRWVAPDRENRGVYSLATMGPGVGSKIGPPVNATIRNVDNIIDVESGALSSWREATW